MMRWLDHIHTRLRSFAEDTRGALTAEFVIIMPVLVTLFVGTFVYYEGFRIRNMNLKAAYALSDMLTREEWPINQTYLNGLHDVFDFIAQAEDEDNTYIRVSSLRYNEDDESYSVDWSKATDEQTVLTNQDMQEIAGKLPAIASGDRLILVETFMDYDPLFNVGLDRTTFSTFIPALPRFVPKLDFAEEAAEEAA